MFQNPFFAATLAASHLFLSANPFLAATPMARAIAASHELCRYPEEIQKSANLDIASVRINGEEVGVKRTLLYAEPYTRFWLYEPDKKAADTIIRLVNPPNSGQTTFPMARGMVTALLKKGYLTVVRENIDPENVPLKHGPYGLDEDVAASVNFIKYIHTDIQAYGLCQGALGLTRAGCVLGEQGYKYLRSVATVSAPLNPKAASTKITQMVDMLGSATILRSLEKINSGGRLAGDGQIVCPKDKLVEGYLSLDLAKHSANCSKAFLALMSNNRTRYKEIMKPYDSTVPISSRQNVPGKLFEDGVVRIYEKNLFVRDLDTWQGRPISGRNFKASVLHFGSEADQIVHYRQATPKGLFPNATHTKAHIFNDYDHFKIIGDEAVSDRIIDITDAFNKSARRRDRPRPPTPTLTTLREGLSCALPAQDLKIAAYG